MRLWDYEIMRLWDYEIMRLWDRQASTQTSVWGYVCPAVRPWGSMCMYPHWHQWCFGESFHLKCFRLIIVKRSCYFEFTKHYRPGNLFKYFYRLVSWDLYLFLEYYAYTELVYTHAHATTAKIPFNSELCMVKRVSEACLRWPFRSYY